MQVHGGDQSPLPAQVDSFVGCSLHCALHPPAEICRSLTSIQTCQTHTPPKWGKLRAELNSGPGDEVKVGMKKNEGEMTVKMK